MVEQLVPIVEITYTKGASPAEMWKDIADGLLVPFSLLFPNQVPLQSMIYDMGDYKTVAKVIIGELQNVGLTFREIQGVMLGVYLLTYIEE